MTEQNYKFITKHGKKSVFTCLTCNKTFSAVSNKLKFQKPCGCGKNYYNNPTKRLFKVLDYCRKNNFLLEVFDDKSNAKSSNYTIKSKTCDHSFKTNWKNLVKENYGCPSCAKNKPNSKEKVDLLLSEFCDENNLSFSYIQKGHAFRNEVLISCKSCGLEKSKEIGAVLRDKVQCECKWDRGFKTASKAWFYILAVENLQDSDSFIKIGITSNLNSRINSLKYNNSKFKISKLFSWESSGKSCKDFENFCKKNYRVYENNMNDGHTECLSLTELYSVSREASRFFNAKG